MDKAIIEVHKRFWNIRGNYRVAGVLNVGTQASLVQLRAGGFVLLDACDFSESVRADLRELTGDGADLHAIINLHPFHTLHVEAAHALFPDAPLHGTVRHHERFPDLPWQAEKSESEALHRLFADDLRFSVPRGVDFVSDNEHVHFSSVLAYHPRSHTIHSDDTFNNIPLAGLLARFGLASQISFHPTLASALQKREDAAAEFRGWAHELIRDWRDARNLCAAHSAAWLGKDHPADDLDDLLGEALARVERVLSAHERKYG